MSAAAASTLVTGIGELVTCDGTGPDRLGIHRDAARGGDGRIAWLGPSGSAPAADRSLDLAGRAVLPGFVDSHSHLVFAGDRAAEFAARMAGQPYDGGGIGVSVAATRAPATTSSRAWSRPGRRDAGPGHHHRGDQEWLRPDRGRRGSLAAHRRGSSPPRRPTSAPTWSRAEYAADRTAYLDLVTGPMLAAAAPHARWTDVFCEPRSAHAFTEEEARVVLLAARGAGLGLRVHGNQLGPGPGVRSPSSSGAASVDHCTYPQSADVEALASAAGTTVATLLPGVEFSTRSPYPDAAACSTPAVSLALATDCNPGTCYSSSMPFVIALAVREMGLTPAEAVYAATAGSALSLRRSDIGRIEVGARADLAVLEAPSHLHLAYRAGVPIARTLDLPRRRRS